MRLSFGHTEFFSSTAPRLLALLLLCVLSVLCLRAELLHIELAFAKESSGKNTRPLSWRVREECRCKVSILTERDEVFDFPIDLPSTPACSSYSGTMFSRASSSEFSSLIDDLRNADIRNSAGLRVTFPPKEQLSDLLLHGCEIVRLTPGSGTVRRYTREHGTSPNPVTMAGTRG